MNNCEPHKPLLAGLLDNELTPDETRAINEHLTRCATCRRDYEQLRETSGKLAAITFDEPDDAIVAQVWRSPFSRATHIAAWLLIGGGYLVLAAIALHEFLTTGGEELAPRTALAAIVLGFLILLVQVVRQRCKTYQTDPYREIER
jgi:anti-sigma factor RsiW